MKLQTYVYFIFFLLISIFSIYLLAIRILFPDQEMAAKTLVITSGSPGGNYYNTGRAIEEELNESTDNRYVFRNIPSDGSIGNIKRLKNRFADLAIVQRDELIKSYYGNGNKLKNVIVISPLFQEKLLIYSRASTNIPFNKFKETISRASHPIKIGVTSKSGSTYKTFMDVAALLGLQTDGIEFVENNYDELTNKLRKKALDFVLTFSLPVEDIKKAGANYVYFTDEDIFLLKNRMPYFSEAAILDDLEYKTLGVWALLVGLNSSVEEVGDNTILNHLVSNNSGKNDFSGRIRSSLMLFESEPLLYEKYLSRLPISPALLERIKKVPTNGYWYVILITIILVLATYYFGNATKKSRNVIKYLWIRYNHIFIGLIIVIAGYLLCIEFLIYNEEVLYNSTGIKSPILDLPRADLHVWNIIRVFAQIDGGIFPYSLYGKLVTTLTTYLTLFGAIAIAVSELGMYRRTAKRREGKMKIKHEGHVIICGWSNNSIRLIEDLNTSSNEYHNKSIKIVFVVPDPAAILASHPDISDLEHMGTITFVKGDIRNKEIALQSNAASADSIILTAEDSTESADEKTLLRALSVAKYIRSKVKDQVPRSAGKHTEEFESYKTSGDISSTYIIAEINNEEYIEDLRNAGVNGIVDRGNISRSILIQSLLNPGVSILLNNILSFSGDTNEFYTVDLRENTNKHLRNRTFDELILPLRKQNILLVAIKVIYLDEAGEVIVDVDELEVFLSREKLGRQIITNPINDVETNRKADGDDHLIVLAVSKARLLEGLAQVVF